MCVCVCVNTWSVTVANSRSGTARPGHCRIQGGGIRPRLKVPVYHWDLPQLEKNFPRADGHWAIYGAYQANMLLNLFVTGRVSGVKMVGGLASSQTP